MKVSVCMITYNHKDYIGQAIESILNQILTFDVELIIGEDNSKDGTKEICMSYAAEFPDKIKLITADVNIGMMKNFTRTYLACTGKYIAFCEGDDYWTDPFKLQKQVDFLESSPGYSACFHNVMMKLERDGEKKDWILHESLSKDSFDTEDILGPWFIPSLSVVFVNYPDMELPSWYFNCQYGDLPFMLLLSLRGKFKYIDEVMGVYRLHDGGVSNVHKNYDKIILMVYIYYSFNVHTKYKYQDVIRKACIYEIDRHVPGSDQLHSVVKQSLKVSIKQTLKIIKEVVYKKVIAKGDAKN